MRKPDSVKNVETPRKPPFAQPNPPWYSSTAMSETARRPSSAPTWGSRAPRTGATGVRPSAPRQSDVTLRSS